MILTYPELLHDSSEGKSSGAQESLQNVQRFARRTAEGLPSGLLPAGSAVQEFRDAEKLKIAKAK